MNARSYTRYVWVFLVVLGLLELQFALSLALTGPTAIDNANVEIQGVAWNQIAAKSSEAGLIDYVARSWGAAEVFVAITIIAIAAVPFKREERWSWYFMWLYPALALASVIRNYIVGATSVVLIDSFGGILFAIALLLTYRRFFPKV